MGLQFVAHNGSLWLTETEKASLHPAVLCCSAGGADKHIQEAAATSGQENTSQHSGLQGSLGFVATIRSQA